MLYRVNNEMSELPAVIDPLPLVLGKDKKIKGALVDGDGVLFRMRERHPHEELAPVIGAGFNDYVSEVFGPMYNNILRGNNTVAEHIEYFRQAYGQSDPRVLIAESINTDLKDEEINQPLLEVIREFRQQGLAISIATVQDPDRLAQIKQKVGHEFDRIYATCEMQLLKVEDEDKDDSGRLIDAPPGRYFSHIMGSLAFSPNQIAYFDDRADNVEIARRKGYQAHIYESPEQVAAVLGQ
jgi:FMN phosphatase YigB (HAD superfamily)